MKVRVERLPLRVMCWILGCVRAMRGPAVNVSLPPALRAKEPTSVEDGFGVVVLICTS